MEEIDIVNYDGYYTITKNGDVYSYKNKKKRKLKQQKATQSKKGYYQVRLFGTEGDKRGKLCYVHRLMWLTFKGDIPKGYELQILPVYYDDDPKFTACPGKCEGFQSDFNVHIFWHEQNGRITIPAGTPLCQLVPVRKETIPLELKIADDNILLKAKKRLFQKSNRFTL